MLLSIEGKLLQVLQVVPVHPQWSLSLPLFYERLPQIEIELLQALSMVSASRRTLVIFPEKSPQIKCTLHWYVSNSRVTSVLADSGIRLGTRYKPIHKPALY
jgi:hypothetical protein